MAGIAALADERLLKASLGAWWVGHEVGDDLIQRGQILAVHQRVPVVVDVLHVVVAARCKGEGVRCAVAKARVGCGAGWRCGGWASSMCLRCALLDVLVVLVVVGVVHDVGDRDVIRQRDAANGAHASALPAAVQRLGTRCRGACF